MSLICFSNCRVFDGHSEALIENASVLVENDRFVEVSAGTVKAGDAVALDLDGRVVMPGMIDAHVHACAPAMNIFEVDHMPPSLRANHAGAILSGMLRRGFTTVRDAGGADRGLWLAIEKGVIEGPRLFYSGKAISQTGGHGDTRHVDHHEPCGCGAFSGSLTRVADGVDAVRLAVRQEFQQGAHQIKIMASGGVLSQADPMWMDQFTDAEISAAVQEAATRRSYVMAHCHTDAAARRCVTLGVRSIEHGSHIEPDTARLIAEKGAFVVPTLTVTDVIRKNGPDLNLPSANVRKIEGLYERIHSSIATCARAGVKIGLGSDLLGANFHRLQGMELVLRGEVSPAIDVLRSATSVNAELLQQDGQLGCIMPGALADLIVLDFDPFRSLAPFADPERNIPLVMKGGQIVRNALRGQLQRSLAVSQ